MFRFSIFGIPVEVQPFFWVVMALFGGAAGADSKEDFLMITLFVLAAFISVLVHELGHALTGRRLGGGYATIMLTSFGGLAMNQGGRFDRQQRFWMIAAGPGAGFALLLAVLAILGVFFHSYDVIALTSAVLFRFPLPPQTMELIEFLREKPFISSFLRDLIWINFWWGVINLLPVLPLDGGQITDLYVRPQRRVHLIGAIAAAATAMVGFVYFNQLYMAILFGYFAWKNYQAMQENSWR